MEKTVPTFWVIWSLQLWAHISKNSNAFQSNISMKCKYSIHQQELLKLIGISSLHRVFGCMTRWVPPRRPPATWTAGRWRIAAWAGDSRPRTTRATECPTWSMERTTVSFTTQKYHWIYWCDLCFDDLSSCSETDQGKVCYPEPRWWKALNLCT